MGNIMEIDRLQKRFGDVQAVKDLSFRVREGELFAFLGVNGAGKSTTINILCGQLPRDGGSVIIDGCDLDRDLGRVKRELGVVFQSSVLDKALSVRDNLESRAALYGISGAAFRTRLSELAELLEGQTPQPLCLAQFSRRSAGVAFADGTVCELCGDVGALAGGGKEEALCEIEVELKQGDPETAAAFAAELCERFGLQEQPLSKFARAAALATK